MLLMLPDLLTSDEIADIAARFEKRDDNHWNNCGSLPLAWETGLTLRIALRRCRWER